MEFKTAAEENAGTDANVYFQMIGEEGESQEIELKNKGNGYFNRGQLDRFRIRAKDVGRVSEKRSNDPECPFFQFLCLLFAYANADTMQSCKNFDPYFM